MGSPEDFDFWLVTWCAKWGDEGAHGTNSIATEYGGRVVYERAFRRPPRGWVELQGVSVSVYDGQTDRWRQTWVDDKGSYFALEGGMENGQMVLLSDSGYRMMFFDIAGGLLPVERERRASRRTAEISPG